MEEAESMTTSEGFYIESASTGRFRKLHGASDTRGWRLPAQSNAGVDRELGVLVRFAFAGSVGSLFLQGILSGLSLSALYEAFSPGVYSAIRANEIRRYFFIGISICVTGVLTSLLDDDAIVQVMDSIKGGGTLSSVAKSNVSLLLLYSVALVITLLCSHTDVARSSNSIYNEDLVDRDLQSKWRGFYVARSLLCITGWLVSCYRFVQERSNVRRDE